MKELQLKIVSPEDILFDGKVRVVKLPGTEGDFSILHGHAPLISSLRAGDIEYESEGTAEKVTIQGGFIEVKQNVVTVCVE
ncbi:MAG: ATP synthase F1 subunit epsilon [Dysgonomonas sp.]|nr:ATP synthase F1 subunit epsilon [Dysgonomonas sp.]